MADALPFDLLTAELAALAAELGDEIPLKRPESLIEAARTVAGDPALSAAWGVKGDVYSAVAALGEVVDRHWPQRPMPWHLARVCLWFESQGEGSRDRGLRGPSADCERWVEITQAYRMAAPRSREGDGRSTLSERVEAARLLLERCPHDGFALEGLKLPEDDLDHARYADVMRHLAAHQASPEAQDFMTSNLRALGGSSWHPSEVGQQFFVAERAHHLVQRILAEEIAWPPGDAAISRLYDTIDAQARAHLLEAMAPGLGDHPAAEQMQRFARPDLLVAGLLCDPEQAESVVRLAEQWPGVRTLAAEVSRETLASLASEAPDVARRVFERMPVLLGAVLADDAQTDEMAAVRAALAGAEELVGPIERSGLDLWYRLRALLWIDRPSGLDATLRVLGALFGAPDDPANARRKALTALIDTVAWISIDHWLRLAMSWPLCLAAAGDSKRFQTALRFSAARRLELSAAIGPGHSLEVLRILAADQPPSPPPDHEARLGEAVMNWLRLGTDEAIARAADVLARGTVEAPVRYYDSDVPAEATLRVLKRVHCSGHMPAPGWWIYGLRAAAELDRDALHALFEPALALPLWSATMAAVQSHPQYRGVDPRYVLPWSAAALIEAGEDPGEVIRWMRGMLWIGTPPWNGRTERLETTSAAVLELLTRLQSVYRIPAVLGLLEEEADLDERRRCRDPFAGPAAARLREALYGPDSILLENAGSLERPRLTAAMIDGAALDRLCQQWYAHAESRAHDSVYEKRFEDPSAALLASDLPLYADGLVDALAPRWGWAQPRGDFPRRAIEAAAHATGDALARCLYGMTHTWLTTGRQVWSSAGDPCHWSAHHAPRSVLARAVDALCDLEDEPATHAADVWLSAMGKVVQEAGATPPGLLIGLLNAIARLAPPGSSVLAAAVRSTEAFGSIEELAVHRRLAHAIAKSSSEPRPAVRRLREARQALIRAERRVRGRDDAE